MNVPVHFRAASDPDAASRPAEPVTFGVSMPKGALLETGEWTLRGASFAKSADVTPLDRWGDGSVRWMLVDTQIATAGRDGIFDARLSDETSGAADPNTPIALHDVDDGVTVDTGVVRVVVRSGRAFPFEQVQVAGGDVLDTTSSGLAITDASGTAVRVAVRQVVVEHRGRWRVSLRVQADAVLGGGRKLELAARLEFFAGHGAVRLRCTVRNPDRAQHPGNFWDLGDPGSVLIKDLTLTLAWLPSSIPAEATVSVEPGAEARAVSLPLELYQDSSGGVAWQSTNHISRNRVVPNTFRGYRLRTGAEVTYGERATPSLCLRLKDSSVGVVVPDFWQNFPRAIGADTSAIRVRFFPGQYGDLHELQGGEQKSHDCYLSFGRDTTLPDVEWCRTPTTVAVEPEWTFASGAVDGLAPLDPAHRALVDQAIEGPDSFERKREVIDQFGWRHFGEIYGDHEALGHTGSTPLVSHYNNQYDPILGFGLQFLRTADPRWRQAMNELATHVIDIDIYHADRDKSAYNGGLFWHTYHYGDADTATHRTYPTRNTGKVFGGGPSADHNYPSGLALRYFITGDTDSRDAAIGLAQYVLNLDDWRLSPFRFLSHADTGRSIFTPPAYYGPSRSSGNSLNALIDGHRLTGEARFIDKADQLVRRVVHPLEEPGGNRLDEPEYRWFYAMFLQSLGKYLSHKADRGLVDDAYAHGRASLLNYARWMAEHEYPYLEKPEKLEFPTETWAAQDIRKSDILYYAALHAPGAERGRFIERASFFHRTSVSSLSAMPTRTFARPVIVLLTSGFLHSWFTRHEHAVMPAPQREPDYGRPEPFVSQRAIAERRAKVLAAAGAIVGAGLSAAAAWHWLL